jgi:FKBP-type peptidyl-prolyl cis-trans isomerase FklB
MALVATAALAQTPTFKNDAEKVSYMIGHQIGSNLKRDGIEVDQGLLNSGLKDALAGTKSPITAEEQQKLMQDLQKGLREKAEAKRKADGDKNVAEGKKFLEENKKKPGVVTTASGLQYKILTEGKGEAPKATDTVKTHYKGTLLDGTEFDSSIKRGQPATFPVNGVIKGWTEALQMMKPGAKWQLWIPAELGYGDRGAGDQIGPNAMLTFEVELLEIVKKEEKSAAATPPAGKDGKDAKKEEKK